jgi:hypothetical protein
MSLLPVILPSELIFVRPYGGQGVEEQRQG